MYVIANPMPTTYQLSHISIDGVSVSLRTNGKEIYYYADSVRTLLRLTLKNVKITLCEMPNECVFPGTTMTEIIKCCQEESKDTPQYKSVNTISTTSMSMTNTLCNTLELLADRNFKTWLSEHQAVREKAIANGAVVVKEVGSVPEFGIIVYMEQIHPYRTYYDLDKKLFAYQDSIIQCVTIPNMINVVTDQYVVSVCDNIDFHMNINNSALTKTRIDEINTTVAKAVNDIMVKNGSCEFIIIGEHSPYRMWVMHRVKKTSEQPLNIDISDDTPTDKLASSEAMCAPQDSTTIVLNSEDLVGVIKTLLKRVVQLEKVIESARIALSDDGDNI